jgi:hypothetical protein
MGLLNTVSSDDELAGVMAHEMGHVERRHAVTLEEKANILGVLIGVLSILSPIAYALGGYGGDLAMNKFSRQDELQADQYGLLLMSRAGYDPQAMVDFMDELRQMEETPETPTDKWMESHPVPSDRISHLMGYPQLDRPTADQVTAQAIHDEDEGRFSYSQARFDQALKINPNDTLATQHLAQVDIALKNTSANGCTMNGYTNLQGLLNGHVTQLGVTHVEAILINNNNGTMPTVESFVLHGGETAYVAVEWTDVQSSSEACTTFRTLLITPPHGSPPQGNIADKVAVSPPAMLCPSHGAAIWINEGPVSLTRYFYQP